MTDAADWLRDAAQFADAEGRVGSCYPRPGMVRQLVLRIMADEAEIKRLGLITGKTARSPMRQTCCVAYCAFKAVEGRLHKIGTLELCLPLCDTHVDMFLQHIDDQAAGGKL